MSRNMIEAVGLTKIYQDGELKNEIFKGIHLGIEEGKFAAIIGKSGSGKSTLLNILGGLDRADEGEITVCGKGINRLNDKEMSAYRSRNMGFVFQSFNLIPVLSVWENITLPARFAGLPADEAYVKELMAMLEQACRHFCRRAHRKPGRGNRQKGTGTVDKRYQEISSDPGYGDPRYGYSRSGGCGHPNGRAQRRLTL